MRSRRLACLLLASAAVVSCSRSAQYYLDSGNRYAQKKQYKEAIVEYRNAIQKDPKYGAARLKLAEAYMAADDLGNAAREYIRASDLLPENAGAHEKAAAFLLASGQFEDARVRAGRALKADPKNINAQIILANATAGMKDFDGAIREIQEAISIDPASARSYSSLGA